MTKGTQHSGLTILMTLLAVLAVLVVGCASRGLREPVQMKGPFLSPQMQSFNQELRAARTQAQTTEVQDRLKELESTVRQTVDRLEHLSDDFRKTQEELVRVRLERALERQATEQKSGGGVIRLEEEMPAPPTKSQSLPKASVPSSEAKQHLKELLDQIQGLLERY